MCVVSFHYGMVFLAHIKAKRLAVSQKEEKEIVTFYGLGPFEMIWGLSLFGYMCYNGYKVWKDSDGDKEY